MYFQFLSFIPFFIFFIFTQKHKTKIFKGKKEFHFGINFIEKLEKIISQSNGEFIFISNIKILILYTNVNGYGLIDTDAWLFIYFFLKNCAWKVFFFYFSCKNRYFRDWFAIKLAANWKFGWKISIESSIHRKLFNWNYCHLNINFFSSQFLSQSYA